MSLYRKYRPNSFSEVVGQTHIVRTLTNAIKNNRIGQAYLFTGPRGTGKTTLARIFAKTANCLSPQIPDAQQKDKPSTSQPALEPCLKCDSCRLIQENRAMDLLEIDAASHTGVDNIRQLKETVPVPPSALKYKVYIIDEVHMLSIGAFNALLKTLEEPPQHAIFILATTELHKVPETIISRCQRFDFSRFTQDQIIHRLRQIAKSENVEIDDEALETIALEAEGGMRDAESLLGQIIALEDKKITSQEVNQILGTSSKKLAIDFTGLLLEGKTELALEELEKIQADGVNLKNFNKNILSFLRHLLLLKSNPTAVHLVPALTKEQVTLAQEMVKAVTLAEILEITDLFQKSLVDAKNTPIPLLPMEMAVIQHHVNRQEPSAANPMPAATPTVPPVTPPAASIQPTAPNPPTTTPDSNIPLEELKDAITPPNSQSLPENQTDTQLTTDESLPGPAANVTIEKILDSWNAIIEAVKPMNHSIHAFLANCIPAGITDGQLCIKTKYDFYKDKLNEPQNKLTLQQVIAKIIGGTLKVKFVTEQECANLKFDTSSNPEADRNILHDAMQVMGGKIVE